MKIGLDCKEVSRLISAGLDQSMPVPDRARLRYHFVLCKACRTVDEQMQFLRRAMREMDEDKAQDKGQNQNPKEPPSA
jgi:predicted anti-sigma-YlaC factor YlaD